MILINLGNLKEAEISIRKAINLKPNSAENHSILGEILNDLGNLKEAEISIRKAIDLNPNSAENYYSISKIFTQIKDFDKALESILKAIDIDKNNHIYQGELTRIKFIKGDLDEKLNINKLPYNDNDDYFYEDNHSDTLLIIFASNGRGNSKIPSFNFYNLFKGDKSYDKLFLRDIDRNYYLTGLKNSTKDIKSTIELINRLTPINKYRFTLSIGASSGGFAAILYGQLLNLSKAIAFNPQTVISIEKESVVKDYTYTQEVSKHLRRINLKDNFYQKCLNLKNFQPFTTKVELHYSKFSTVDKNHAKYLKHTNCSLIEHATSSHLLALELRDLGKLKSIVQKNLNL